MLISMSRVETQLVVKILLELDSISEKRTCKYREVIEYQIG